MLSAFADLWSETLIWGLLATIVMTSILSGSQGYGLTRLSLSFLAGTFFTGDRARATVIGYFVYLAGGWAFAYIYMLVLVSVPFPGLVTGTVTGLVHGFFLLTVVLRTLPYVHPRMASDYDGPNQHQRLEPPGFLGLNYGRGTPLVTLIAQSLYGLILGGLYQFAR